MLKYEGRISSFSGGVEIHVTREGLPLTGKKLFRNVFLLKNSLIDYVTNRI